MSLLVITHKSRLGIGQKINTRKVFLETKYYLSDMVSSMSLFQTSMVQRPPMQEVCLIPSSIQVKRPNSFSKSQEDER